jgi:uncharacterized protein (DUF1330 family)
MAYQCLIGLNVTNEARYTTYRERMMPLLHSLGGHFRYDFRVSAVLKGEAPHAINRAFIIAFPDRSTHDRFFADEAYLAIRREHFEGAVDGVTMIAVYQDG